MMDVIPFQPKDNNCPYRKINEAGVYCSFPGITIVSAVGDSNRELWQLIFHELNKSHLFKQHYALLPVESYHMTTLNMYVAETIANWSQFVSERLPFFQSVHKETENHAFLPQVLSIRPEFRGGVLLLHIDIPSDQRKLNFELATKFDMTNYLPNPQFHITLGYIYRKIEGKDCPEIAKEYEDIINRVLSSYNTVPIVLEPPHLTYFPDMTSFIPWDGTFNPFSH
jgi:hypothetical protein